MALLPSPLPPHVWKLILAYRQEEKSGGLLLHWSNGRVRGVSEVGPVRRQEEAK